MTFVFVNRPQHINKEIVAMAKVLNRIEQPFTFGAANPLQLASDEL
jgi:hypothetical protein